MALPDHVHRLPTAKASTPSSEEPTAPVGNTKVLPPPAMGKKAGWWFDFYLAQADGIRRYTQADSQGLAMLAQATADYWDLNELIDEMDRHTDSKKRWTLVSERSSREKLIERMLKEFGLTWKSRGHV